MHVRASLLVQDALFSFLEDFNVHFQLKANKKNKKKTLGKNEKSILKSFQGYRFVGTQLYVFVFCLPTI